MKKTMILLVTLMLVFLTACGGKTDASSESKPTGTTSVAQSGSQSVSATPSPAPTPSASPIPSPTPSLPPRPAVSEDWNGSFAKNAGSSGEIWLTISETSKKDFKFSLDAKGVIISGTAVFSSDGTATYTGKDATLVFAKGQDFLTVEERKQENPNVSFAGEYQNQ